jgi:thiamine transport system ATP-binding protein
MLMLEDLRVTFGDVVALDGTTLQVPGAATTVVMGPSGCGKSTLLRVIAGLTMPDRGAVRWAGRELGDLPTYRRGFGLMFQDYALFPHRSVGANVGFGLRMSGLDPPAVARRTSEVLELVGLEGYADRTIGNLSGGEQQRVALARALAPSPRVLMLDEPIGALDRDLRTQLIGEMRRIFRELGLTVLYVTHDQEEAFGIADHVAVMRRGRVLRAGSPEDLWAKPGSRFVARFIGRENVLSGSDTARVAAAAGVRFAAGSAAVDPDAIQLTVVPDGEATVMESRFVSGRHRLTVAIAGIELVVDSAASTPPGTAVSLTIDPAGLVTLDDDTSDEPGLETDG